MAKSKGSMMHACNYAGVYRGNFIESLQFLSKMCTDRDCVYLFPNHVLNTAAMDWIKELNKKQRSYVYIQEANVIKNVLLLIKIIRKHKIRIIVRHFYDYKLDVILKLIFPSKNIIRFFHCMYDTSTSGSLKHLFKKVLWQKNVLVGVSNKVSEGLKEVFNNFQIKTIENAIYFARLCKEDTFEKENKICLLTMGHNIRMKGVDLALDVVQKLSKEFDIVLYIVFSNNKEQIVSYINKKYCGFPDWVHLLPPTNNIATYLKNVDLFLSPSRTEAFGYAVVEAAYCKTSIVASKVGGQGELEIDSIYWFENENVSEFCEKAKLAIEELGTDKINKKKENDKKRIINRYSLVNWSNNVIQCINEVDK